MLAPARHARLAIAAGIALVAVAVVAFVASHWNSIYDDAFIYLRYVRNIDHGCGPRFNCHGEAVEGFTGPLYLAVLCAGGLVTDQLITLCQLVGAACLVIAGGLAIVTAFALPADRSSRVPIILALSTAAVLALDPFAKLNASIGMETAMAAAVFTLVGFAAITERPRLLLGAVIAGVLVRPEGMLFVVALPFLPWMRRARYLAIAVGAIVAITAGRYAVFGQLAPNTYYAKSGGTWVHFHLGLDYLVEAVSDFPLVLLAPLALLGSRRRACGYFLIVAAGWALFFLRSGGDLFAYSRLWFPLVPMLSAFALAGSLEAARRLRDRPAMLAVPVVLALLVGTRAAISHAIPPQGTNPRVVEWTLTGGWLRNSYPRGTLVATVPIGAIGYYSGLPILDLVGLTEPAIARAGRSVPPDMLTKQWIGHERNFTEYVLQRAPAVIVTTMHRDTPWTLADARAGFWADWLLLQEIKAGRAPYHVRDAEVIAGDHVLMFERDGASRTP